MNKFVQPIKLIKNPNQIPYWKTTNTFILITKFVQLIGKKIKGYKTTDNCEISKLCKALIEYLDELSDLIDETPPNNLPRRYGNTSYRTWFLKFNSNLNEKVKTFLPEKFQDSSIELSTYLSDSFGNYERIDYGTGHELAFLAFLCCFYQLGLIEENDLVGLIYGVFQRYLLLVRKLQQTYTLEAAGTHGVWGLDDFQSLPFYFGSCQFYPKQENENEIEKENENEKQKEKEKTCKYSPSLIMDPEILKTMRGDYLLADAILYTRERKTGSFKVHSPKLAKVSKMEDWDEVHYYFLDMFLSGVLLKYPIVQHFYFGSILSFSDEIKKKEDLLWEQEKMRIQNEERIKNQK
ncbi:serine/threonine-protein phosphatase 2a activator [Anaeramoeba flamelloides]|uniref:Serine/threonine-protein phosphatase 2A activator n=1 Tax=Anaeramoeba flamelloides TaxID=1746091 RepID=A0AAV7YL70_9EUKA|nr:serine/threonine-protein phosphatase 2a activator [Anaeramoeba flamelloides]